MPESPSTPSAVHVTTLHLPRPLWQEAKWYAVTHQTNLTAVVAEALRAFLKASRHPAGRKA